MCVECMLYGVHGMYVNMVENGQRQETCTNDRDDFFFILLLLLLLWILPIQSYPKTSNK